MHIIAPLLCSVFRKMQSSPPPPPAFFRWSCMPSDMYFLCYLKFIFGVVAFSRRDWVDCNLAVGFQFCSEAADCPLVFLAKIWGGVTLMLLSNTRFCFHILQTNVDTSAVAHLSVYKSFSQATIPVDFPHHHIPVWLCVLRRSVLI